MIANETYRHGNRISDSVVPRREGAKRSSAWACSLRRRGTVPAVDVRRGSRKVEGPGLVWSAIVREPHLTARYQALCFVLDSRNTKTKQTSRTSRLSTS